MELSIHYQGVNALAAVASSVTRDLHESKQEGACRGLYDIPSIKALCPLLKSIKSSVVFRRFQIERIDCSLLAGSGPTRGTYTRVSCKNGSQIEEVCPQESRQSGALDQQTQQPCLSR